LPPGYVARDELDSLIDIVISTSSGAVGLTGQASAVGLHGQGGIGKSVLAAAVARDEGVRDRFPDGLFWVTLGENADPLTAQLDLLARLGDQNAAPRTRMEATQRLTSVLRDRRILLVVDDVWSDAAAQAFRVTGPQGRVLYTTRNTAVLTACAATPHQVDVLSAAQARAVAATVLETPSGQVPTAADRAFEAVGQVALAVALLAAAVREGRSWEQVADELTWHGSTYGEHPYANAFKAMQIAVAALAPELATALFGLAVFPRDTQIPITAIARYWAQTRSHDTTKTIHDLQSLAAANVLLLDEGTIEFHDLQHDYLLLHAPALASLHAELLDAYRAALPADGRDKWWYLPGNEPYIWDHLITHLRGAGERAILASTVTNPAYLAHQIRSRGTHAAETDLNRAAEALPDGTAIPWWQRWIACHVHLLTGATDRDGARPGDVSAFVSPSWHGSPPTNRGRSRSILPNSPRCYQCPTFRPDGV
jgi:hypothetical protein